MNQYQVFDARGKALPANFESIKKELQLLINDANADYPITIDPIVQQAYLKASNTRASDQFGVSVAVSGDTVVVGANVEWSNATGVNGNQGDNSASGAGAAYVFVRSGASWSQQAYLKASNTEAGDHFGESVAIFGDTIVVGALFEDSNGTGINGNQGNNNSTDSGAAYVFVRTGTTWSQQAYLKASNTGVFDYFGHSVSIYGDTIVIGAYGEDSSATGANGDQSNNSLADPGAAYVFVRSGSTWSQQAYLKASNTGTLDYFGYSASVSGDTVVVGAYGEDSNATGVNGDQSNNSLADPGAVYVFVRNGTTWSQQAYLKASNTGTLDYFGYSVSVSGDTVVIGAYGEDSNATGVNGDQSHNSLADPGAAYVFVRSGTTWSQQAYLKASNTGTTDEFGVSVAASGDTVVVGAHHEDSDSTSVNGDQSSNANGDAGAAYVFVRHGTNWSTLAYLKASNTNSGDNFGHSVAVSGDSVVVGAYHEDGNAIGVNGDQSNNTCPLAGAAYIFNLNYNSGTASYGTGTSGCAGPHTLGVTHSPMINSPNFAITCNNAPPNSLGLGLITDSQDLAGSDAFNVGVLVHSDFIFATEVLNFDFFSDGTGYSETVGTGIPNDASLIGKTFYASALWSWQVTPSCNFCSNCASFPYCANLQLPCWHFPYGLSSSNGLAITILAP